MPRRAAWRDRSCPLRDCPLKDRQFSKRDIGLPEKRNLRLDHITHAYHLHQVGGGAIFRHIQHFIMLPGGGLFLMQKPFVPALQLRLHARDDKPVRHGLCDPLAGFLPGLVAVEVEVNAADVRMLRKVAFQCLISHAAERKIAARLPVLREQVDEGKKVNRRFKHAKLVARSLIAEPVGLVRSGNIQPEAIRRPPAVSESRKVLQISPDKNQVVVLRLLIDISGVQEEIDKPLIQSSDLHQIILRIDICHIPHRQMKLRCGCGGSLMLSFVLLTDQKLHGLRRAE